MSDQSPPGSGSGRAEALAIGVGSVLSVVLMAHHPSTRASDMAEGIAQTARAAGLSGLVHGGLIVTMVVVFFGVLGLAGRLGWFKARVRAGALAYGLGVVAMAGAALVSGFLVPGFARAYAGASGVDADALRPIFQLCYQTNQVLARAGTMALSAATLVWSLVMLERDPLARAVGALGLAAGALPVLGLLSGYLRLTVHGMGAVVLLLAVWNVAAAVWLIRSR
jgi:hypothetical protein